MEPDLSAKVSGRGGDSGAAKRRNAIPPFWKRRPLPRRGDRDADKVPAAAGWRAARAGAGTADADMPRPYCKRYVGWQPNTVLFKPAGIPAGEMEWIVLSLDEVEALRLADLNGHYQEQAAGQMKISRATFARIVESARRKVADALVHGQALHIQAEPGSQPPEPAPHPGACHRRGCGCKGRGRNRGRFIQYSTPERQT